MIYERQARNSSRLARGKSTQYRPNTRLKHLRSSRIRELADEYLHSSQETPRETPRETTRETFHGTLSGTLSGTQREAFFEAKPSLSTKTPNFTKKKESLESILKDIGMNDYIEVFQENQITLEDLPYLTEEDLKDLDLPYSYRKILLGVIQDFSEEEEYLEDQSLEAKENPKLQEVQEILLEICEQQKTMMKMIRANQEALATLLEKENKTPSNAKFFEPTLSSIAKQKAIPNKYMRVSPLRVSYMQKYKSSE